MGDELFQGFTRKSEKPYILYDPFLLVVSTKLFGEIPAPADDLPGQAQWLAGMMVGRSILNIGDGE